MKYYLMINIIAFFIKSNNILFAIDQNSFIINHLVENDEGIFRLITQEPVSGNIYRYFSNGNLKSENVFVGKITNYGKQGIWTRWWNNGQIKSQGFYEDSIKKGVWTDWMKNGEKYSETFYKNGSILYLKNCTKENCD